MRETRQRAKEETGREADLAEQGVTSRCGGHGGEVSSSCTARPGPDQWQLAC